MRQMIFSNVIVTKEKPKHVHKNKICFIILQTDSLTPVIVKLYILIVNL